ncbi:MAG: carbamoyl phosphate synthase small subunit [Clostridium sp.]|jgi:carbamoyl-phosphate synthase small subunit|nr:carbamoyl phosphate synthase small subunit [Clostridium sp.]
MNRYLVLEDGTVFKGKAFGADREVTAEIVFTTAMTGYMETLTDKSYKGQAVVQTFPLIGNYGIIREDQESGTVGPSAYIVREWCSHPSNFRCEGDLDSYLREHHIPGLYGIDTRTLTRLLRERGTMNGAITDNPDSADLEKIRLFRCSHPITQVTIHEPTLFRAGKSRRLIVMLDFGRKDNILRSLLKRDCDVWVLPAQTAPEKILKYKPDGIFLTNGPGDPSDNPEIIEHLKELSICGIPMMGICMGHQLLALAHGFQTEKMKYGHRGANQPVKDMRTGKIYITSQNHGYAVKEGSVAPSVAETSFINVNDGTNEGLRYKGYPVCSVQFHPEACAGPKDTDFLFDEFVSMLGR